MKDNFFTINYKGFYIQSCFNRSTGKEEIKAFGIIRGKRYEKINIKSDRAAKLWVSKIQNSIYKTLEFD